MADRPSLPDRLRDRGRRLGDAVDAWLGLGGSARPEAVPIPVPVRTPPNRRRPT